MRQVTMDLDVLTQLGPAFTVMKREVRDQMRDWRIIFPVIVLTLIFPGLMNFTARQLVGFVSEHGAPIVGDRLIPFLLMIVGFFPISVSLVMALESFVGEKERHSIEPLLSSPLSDGQLYLGKLLAAMIPPLLASYLGVAVYLTGVYLSIGWTPDPILLIQILLLTAVQAIVMVSGAVVVSSQTTSIRAANLLASFIIIPMALLIQGESVVMFWAIYSVLWLAILGQLVIAGLLIRTGVAHFNREELLGRELDELNLKWVWSIFKHRFIGNAHSLVEWYRVEITAVLHRLRIPMICMILALAGGLWAGASQARIFVIPPEVLKLENMDQGFVQGLDAVRFFSASGVGLVWLHNLRTVLLATLLGIFSFGVLGVLVLMLPFMIIGYFMSSLAAAGSSPLLFLAGLVLPHGVFEIPALIFVGAAILNMGGTLAAPAKGMTVGEAWLVSVADWAKIFLGVIVPILLCAAFVEVMITPHIAVYVLGH